MQIVKNTKNNDTCQITIGFMKKFQSKGDISILTENELLYLKTILKE